MKPPRSGGLRRLACGSCGQIHPYDYCADTETPRYSVEISPGLKLEVEKSGNVVLLSGLPQHTVTNVQRLIDELEIARAVAEVEMS